ncbi:hypothetical protein ORI89_05410 [Sphingobacterium sp. UT-1RO-CII-1]|uniref:WapI family immunity protein n=1 Tax=Sphingobacterium sp. UT-1RO-CII-1 TaxID=2995225 RepID=UPI00227B4A5C|nr:hypothetical protein [Sphingobacterium sp. UT-1RO-CII-1]MCY4779077.1 hypothetical protein [Sphingobacterium sp. UT-1RO-CII-1]
MNEDLEFQIKSDGDFVKLNPAGLIYYDSILDWDKNWIRTVITVQGGVFSGKYNADLTTFDFDNLKCDLEKLYDNLGGEMEFDDLEGFLSLKIVGDGTGNFVAEVTCNDAPGIYSSELSFQISFDQTYIKDMVRRLDEITKRHPVVGDFKKS